MKYAELIYTHTLSVMMFLLLFREEAEVEALQ
jgi:hypothetical protein